MIRIGLMTAAVALVCGCQSYDIVQSNVFSDEDGNIVKVDYGRSEKDHVNYFIAPSNRKKMEFKSKLVVDVHLPDGDTFTAWQCMNFWNSGTLYRTDNEEWMLLANGFTTMLYRREAKSDRYLEVYRGILCESPKTDYKPNAKWRKLKQDGKGGWKYESAR